MHIYKLWGLLNACLVSLPSQNKPKHISAEARDWSQSGQETPEKEESAFVSALGKRRKFCSAKLSFALFPYTFLHSANADPAHVGHCKNTRESHQLQSSVLMSKEVRQAPIWLLTLHTAVQTSACPPFRKFSFSLELEGVINKEKPEVGK